MLSKICALNALDRLEDKSLNRNLTEWEKKNSNEIKISSLNCRSLKKHFDDITSDDLIMKGDLICLQETWLEMEDREENFQIPGFALHLNSKGRGKGIATYYKENIFQHETDISDSSLQISKFSSPNIDILALYRSQNCNLEDLQNHLQALTERKKAQIIIGDFNICQLASTTISS